MSPSESANLLLGLVAIVAVASTLVSMACLVWVTRDRRRHLADYSPPVTIFKPLKGLDEELEANLRSFFRLDYPTFQLLFCVADADDPAIEVVKKLQSEFPGQDAQLVVGCRAFGLNPKVESLAAMEPYRKHDVILISDSNVRVRPSYLRETACYLAEPGVGLVSNLFVGVGEAHPSAIMENLQLNGIIAGAVALASVCGITCVVGKSMLMPIRVLAALGGFAAVRNILGEDQVFGIRVRRAGYSIRLSHHVIENVNCRRSFRWFLNRHSRWSKIRRRLALPSFLFEPVANLACVGLVWAFSGESGIAWGGLLLLVGLGMARDALQTRWMRGSFPKLRHLVFSPAKDILLLPIWFDAIVNRRVLWRGHRFSIGRMTRLREVDISSREVRRRARRVRKLRARNDHSHDRSAG
jgi:ceramide glucosyltransferase